VRHLALCLALAACNGAPPPSPALVVQAAPQEDPAWLRETDRLSVAAGMTEAGLTGAVLRSRYEAIAEECGRTRWEVLKIHRRLFRKTGNADSINLIPSLCRIAERMGE